MSTAQFDLLRMFSARSIAVIGASTTGSKPSGQPLLHLRNLGYEGQVYPINPRYTEVFGWPCFPDVAALPEVPDVALIAVSADQVIAQLEACGRKGICQVIVITPALPRWVVRVWLPSKHWSIWPIGMASP